MWRLLVVLALCGASLVKGGQQWVSCSNMTTAVQNVSLIEGSWTAQKMLKKDASFFLSLATCYLNEISTSSDRRLTMIFDRHIEEEDGEEIVETYQQNFGENKGRWIGVNMADTEVLLVSTDPSNYLLMTICDPEWKITKQEKSNDLEDTVVFQVFVFTRRHRSGNLSEENLAKIIDDAIKTHGLQNYDQLYFTNPNC